MQVVVFTLKSLKIELLKDMAIKLGVGSAELSQIEHGKKTMPEGFLGKIQQIYFDKN